MAKVSLLRRQVEVGFVLLDALGRHGRSHDAFNVDLKVEVHVSSFGVLAEGMGNQAYHLPRDTLHRLAITL